MSDVRCQMSDLRPPTSGIKMSVKLFYMILATALCGCVPIRDVGAKTLEDSFSVMTYNIWDLNGKRPAVEDVVEVIRSEGIPDLIHGIPIIKVSSVDYDDVAITIKRAIDICASYEIH